MKLGMAHARKIDTHKRQRNCLRPWYTPPAPSPQKVTCHNQTTLSLPKPTANWVHHPHEDALVNTAEVANNLIHRLLVDSRSAVNILYWGAYQKTGLRWADLTPTTSPLYGFTEDSVIPEGTIKLVVTLGEPPRTTTVMIDFLAVKCPSASNWVLRRLLLKALKAVTSIHCLTIKFPTTAGIGHVWGRQQKSKECYCKSLELAEMEP